MRSPAPFHHTWRVAAAALGLCLIAAVLWLVLRDSRGDLQPELFVSDGTHEAGIALLTGAVNVTAETCRTEFPCTSAWGSDDMVLMKFATKDEAAVAARSLGAAAYRSDWLVAHFIGASVSDTERRHAAEALDGTWQDHVD